MINVILYITPIITLIVGFYFGFRIGKDKDIPKVEVNPLKIVKEEIEQAKEEKETKKEREILEQYMENIDNYPKNQIRIKE